MSPRKPTLDDVDDTDDQDGMQQDEKRQNSDLKLRRRKADEVDLAARGSRTTTIGKAGGSPRC